MKWFGKAIKGFIFLAVFLLLVGISTKATEAYPAPKIIHAGVESFKSADTSTAGTFMDAMITGPSPEAFTKYHDLRYGGKYVIAPVFQWQPGGRYVAVWPKSLATGKWMLPDWIKASK